MLTIEKARTRVTRGAAHLDVHRPGWFNEIDTGTLTLHDSCRCIVGQLYGDYGTLDADWLAYDAINCDEAELGFHVLMFDDPHESDQSDPGWVLLQDAWIEAIADRKLAASAKLIETTHPAPVPVQA